MTDRLRGVADGCRPVCRQVTVDVPATSANLGSGFDCAGLALDFCDHLTFTLPQVDPDGSGVDRAERAGREARTLVTVKGEGQGRLPVDGRNLVASTFRRACAAFGLEVDDVFLEADNRIPQARGMGSSASALVGAVAAADAFCHSGRIDRHRVFELAASYEGHPDNVAPAVYGGLTISWPLAGADREGPGGYGTVGYPVDEGVEAAILVPDFRVPTSQARQILPDGLSMSDAVFNMARVGLLPAALGPSATEVGATGSGDRREGLLYTATQDRVHQPFRRSLMPASWTLVERLRGQGLAAAISGAGPSVIVLHRGRREEIAHLAGPELAGGHWDLLDLPIRTGGVEVTRG